MFCRRSGHSGWFGWTRAIGDAVTGLPEQVEKIYDAAKRRYLAALRKAFSTRSSRSWRMPSTRGPQPTLS